MGEADGPGERVARNKSSRATRDLFEVLQLVDATADGADVDLNL